MFNKRYNILDHENVVKMEKNGGESHQIQGNH